MNYSEMTIEELQERRAAIATELDNPEANLDELENEARSINEEIEKRRAAEAKKAEIRKAVADGDGVTVKKMNEDQKMDNKEFRNSAAYIEKYAEYVKHPEDKEARAALLSENVDGQIAVPDVVLDTIKTAWEKSDILRRIPKTYIKGNLKVQFEIDGSLAVKHTEGGAAVEEETLTEGIVTLVPSYFKKWKSVSREVMSLRGEAFLRYIYDEITDRVIKAIEKDFVESVSKLTNTATETAPAVGILAAAPGVGTVASAIGLLSDEASQPIIIMNKQTWSAFKAAQYANGFAVDPFEGLEVAFNNNLPAFASADAGNTYMIVGDMNGALANFPNGETVEFIFDELTRKKEDLVEVLGELYGAVGVVAMNSFVLVNKPE